MFDNYDYTLAWIVQFLLILIRIASLFTFTPLLARAQVPAMAKIGLSVLISFMVINYAPPVMPFPYDNIGALVFAVMCELIVGLVMGFVTMLYFNIVYTAGHIIDMQVGFSMSQVYDVSTGGQVAISASLLNMVMIISFVMNNGIEKLIYTITQTFNKIPTGSGVFRLATVELMIDYFIRCFTLSLQVAMPVLASALLAEIALGIIVRTAPQMNVFVIGMPLKVILGLLILAFMIPAFVSVCGSVFDDMFYSIETVLGGMVP